MKRYNYAKIPLVSAIALGLDKIRRHTPSGDVVINESDLLTYGSEDYTFEQKVEELNGKALTALEAKQELQKTE